MSGIVDSLVEMGFDRHKAELAASRSGGTDLPTVMDWLLSHEDELDAPEQIQQQQPEIIQQPQVQETTTGAVQLEQQQEVVEDSDGDKTTTEPPAAVVGSPAPIVKSLKCDDCGKLFKTQEEVEFHASKSGHEHFSESTEEKKPLTDEEKKEQLAKIEAKLRQRRLDREAREKEEALLKEKNRIKSGKELLEAKKKHDELEMRKLVEQRKREKEEEKLARQRVKEQIEQDKLARKAKFGGGNPTEIASTIQNKPQTVVSKPTSAIQHTEVKLQIRLTDGNMLMQTFGAKEPLSAVKVFIELNAPDAIGTLNFDLMNSFPRKVFENEDYNKPLDSLGLAPTATLIVKRA